MYLTLHSISIFNNIQLNSDFAFLNSINLHSHKIPQVILSFIYKMLENLHTHILIENRVEF